MAGDGGFWEPVGLGASVRVLDVDGGGGLGGGEAELERELEVDGSVSLMHFMLLRLPLLSRYSYFEQGVRFVMLTLLT